MRIRLCINASGMVAGAENQVWVYGSMASRNTYMVRPALQGLKVLADNGDWFVAMDAENRRALIRIGVPEERLLMMRSLKMGPMFLMCLILIMAVRTVLSMLI